MASAARCRPSISIFFCATPTLQLASPATILLRPPPNLRFFSACRTRWQAHGSLTQRSEPNVSTQSPGSEDNHIPWQQSLPENLNGDQMQEILSPPFSKPLSPSSQDEVEISDTTSWFKHPQSSSFTPSIKLDGQLKGFDVAELRGTNSQMNAVSVTEIGSDVPQLSKNRRKRLRRLVAESLSEQQESHATTDPKLPIQTSVGSEGTPDLESSISSTEPSENAQEAPHQILSTNASEGGLVASAQQDMALEETRDAKIVGHPTKSKNRTTEHREFIPISMRRSQRTRLAKSPHAKDHVSDPTSKPEPKAEEWQTQKAQLKEKFPEGWSPQKRLSPDALEGIRALNTQYPDQFTTPVLAEHFKVSPEAIRRILRGKWRPSAQEEEDRKERWGKRGEKIWEALLQRGVHPPKKWREKGIGKGPRRQVVMSSSTAPRAMRSSGVIPWT